MESCEQVIIPASEIPKIKIELGILKFIADQQAKGINFVDYTVEQCACGCGDAKFTIYYPAYDTVADGGVIGKIPACLTEYKIAWDDHGTIDPAVGMTFTNRRAA